MSGFDPIQRTREYHQRVRGEYDARVKLRRMADAAAGWQAVATGSGDEQYVETLADLPEADASHAGRLLYQRRDSANDLLYLGIINNAGDPQWVLVSELQETVAEIGLYKWSQYTTLLDGLWGVASTGSELLVVEQPGPASAQVRRRNLTTGANIGTFGSYGTGSGQFQNPRGIAVSAAGSIHVADSNNGRVVQFNSSRTFVRNIGSSGSGNGNLSSPTAVACDSSNNVYVADTGNSRIAVFSSTGTWLRNIGSAGTGNGQFSSVYGLAVSAAGELFAADSSQNRIQVFTASTGAFLRTFGTYGSANGQLSGPNEIALDADGDLYVADTMNSRVQKFAADGTFLMKFGTRSSSGAWNVNGVACQGSDVYLTASMSDGRYRPSVKQYTVIPAGGIEVAANSAATSSARAKLNFIAGTGMSVTVADDSTNLEADITLAISPTVERVQGTGVNLGVYSGSLPGYVSGTVTTASCTGGASANVMIGGGCGDTPSRQVHVVASYPSNSTTWTCGWSNYNATTSFTMYPYIICLRK